VGEWPAPGTRRGVTVLGVLIAVFVAIWILLRTYPVLRNVLFLAFGAIVVATVFSFPIERLARWLPRWAATLLTAVLTVLLTTLLCWYLIPIFLEQGARLVERLPAAIDRAHLLWRKIARHEFLSGPGAADQLAEQLRTYVTRLAAGAIPLAFTLLASIANFLIVLVLALFLAYRPSAYLKGILRLVPSELEPGTERTLRGGIEALRGWAFGALISMTVIGVLTAFGLWIIGVDLWLALGVLAFFGEFVPYVGPIVAAVPGIAVALVASPETALKALAVYIVVQQIEANLLHPLVMRWAVHIEPGLLIVWQLAFVGGFGLPGLLVATPLLAFVQAALNRGYVEGTLGKC
jgi:predicted PurR-regulated permease PerM